MKRQRGRGRKPVHNSNRAFESSGPDVKIRGSAQHIFEKYQQLARDSASGGDRVMAENYLQHAEHYFRILAASGPPGVNPALRDRTEGLARNGAGEDDRTEDSDVDSEDGEDDFAPGADSMDQPWVHTGGNATGQPSGQHGTHHGGQQGGRERGFERGRAQERSRDDRGRDDRNRDGRQRDDRRPVEARQHDPRRDDTRGGDYRSRDPRRREEGGPDNVHRNDPHRNDPQRNDRRRDQRANPGRDQSGRDQPGREKLGGRSFPREAPREVSGLERTLGRRVERLPDPEFHEAALPDSGSRTPREPIDAEVISNAIPAGTTEGMTMADGAQDDPGRRRRPRGRYRPGARGDGLDDAGLAVAASGESAAFDRDDPA